MQGLSNLLASCLKLLACFWVISPQTSHKVLQLDFTANVWYNIYVAGWLFQITTSRLATFTFTTRRCSVWKENYSNCANVIVVIFCHSRRMGHGDTVIGTAWITEVLYTGINSIRSHTIRLEHDPRCRTYEGLIAELERI